MMDLFWFLHLGLVFPCTTGQWAYDGDNLSHLLSELKILKEAQNECTNKYSELAEYMSRVLSLENTVKDLQDTVNDVHRENAELVQEIHRLADNTGQMETLNVNNYETKGPVEDYPVVHNRDEIINATNTLQERVKEANTMQRDDRRIRNAIGRSFTLRPTPSNPATLNVGDIVIRGPDWVWMDQDGNSTGVVTRVSKGGWVNVRWDKTGSENNYRYGTLGKFDVKLYARATKTVSYSTTLPTVVTTMTISPTTTVSPITAIHTFRVGDRVVRGPDWQWGNQDGKGSGSVRQLPPNVPSGWVQVEWDNGNLNVYRIGAENAYDIMFVPRSYNPPFG